MSDANKKNQFVWAQTVTVHGSKLTLNTSNFKKSWGLKFYEAFRYGKSLKFHVVNSKLPSIIKLFIGCEIAVWLYSKVIKDTISASLTNENQIKLNSINEKLSKNLVYKFFEKENHGDYIANIFTYSLFGKFFYFHSKILTYSIFGIGGLCSILFSKVNDKAKKYSEDQLKIEEFNLYSTQFNLIPKIFLTSSILCGLNFFLTENYYLIRNTIPMNHKIIYLYFLCYMIAKFSRTISNLTHDSLNLRNVEGTAAWLISSLIIRSTLFPCFVLLHYFNPYTLVVWFGAKNNIEEKFVQENYTKKSILTRLKTYFVFVSGLSLSNMLNIYF